MAATNAFVTEPIAQRLGVENLLATEPEMRGGRYTGGVTGTPCFQEGKVERLKNWLAQRRQSLRGSYFYSDSHNDIPLLERVDHPVAVDPDSELSQRAADKAGAVRMVRALRRDRGCRGTGAVSGDGGGPDPYFGCPRGGLRARLCGSVDELRVDAKLGVQRFSMEFDRQRVDALRRHDPGHRRRRDLRLGAGYCRGGGDAGGIRGR